jgi:hypothetical protein
VVWATKPPPDFSREDTVKGHEDRRQMTEDRKQKTEETTFNEKFLRGVQGGGFFKKSPPGRRRQKWQRILDRLPGLLNLQNII